MDDGLTPEGFALGKLSRELPGGGGEEPIRIEFPAPGDDGEGAYAVAGVLAIAKALAAMALKKGVALVHPVGGTIAVGTYEALSGLDALDTAMAHVLESFADADCRAGLRSFRDAMAEPDARHKADHRRWAAGHLQRAYEGYETALRNKKGEFRVRTLGMGGAAIATLHGKAAGVAAMVALVNHSLELAEGAARWTELAAEHHERYCSIAFERAKRRCGLELDGAKKLAAASPFLGWDGRRTRGEWALHLGKLGIGVAMTVAQKGRPNPLLRFETQAERARRAQQSYAQRRNAALEMVKVEQQRCAFDELREWLTTH